LVTELTRLETEKACIRLLSWPKAAHHRQRIGHRSVKPERFILRSQDEARSVQRPWPAGPANGVRTLAYGSLQQSQEIRPRVLLMDGPDGLKRPECTYQALACWKLGTPAPGPLELPVPLSVSDRASMSAVAALPAHARAAVRHVGAMTPSGRGTHGQYTRF
jgi:hypothetical protein